MNWYLIFFLVIATQAFSIPLTKQQSNISKTKTTPKIFKWILEFEMFNRPIFVEVNSIKQLHNNILTDLIRFNVVRLKGIAKMPIEKVTKFNTVIRAG